MKRKKPSQLLTQRYINRLIPFINAPLFHTLQLLATGDGARFHMPGHKGQPIFSSYADIFSIDYTETYHTGNLYQGFGPIRDAEVAAAQYFHAEDCFFLTGGATQGIFAMLATVVGEGGSVLLDRECHQSVCHACALLDITPYFFSASCLTPFSISGSLPLEDARHILWNHPEIKAVLVTSPTYYGVCRDMSALSEICQAYHVKLLVDSAHGAHFPAVGLSVPTMEGAALAVVSTHKTLPCMGQSAALLISAGVNRRLLRENTALFGTSSPSYPILASIDLARAYMEETGKNTYRRAAEYCARLRQFVALHTPFLPLTTETTPVLDPCRLTICTAGTNFSGHQLANRLWSERGIACEMSDAYNVVFILTGADSFVAVRRLRNALRHFSEQCRPRPMPEPAPAFPPAERILSVREAWFSPVERVPLEEAEGRICARPVTPYPPGVPLLWSGEKITAAHVALLQKRWYNTISDIFAVRA